jgi:hypothetical protein
MDDVTPTTPNLTTPNLADPNLADPSLAEADPNLLASLACLRDHRDEMARWLALEVLQFDPFALEDDELLRRLSLCQERLEERLRARTAAPETTGY